MGRGLWQMLVDFVFPPHCPVCHAYVEHLGAWCPDCMAAAQKPHVILLPAAMQPLIGTAWALGRYHGGLRSLIHALKYKKKRSALPCIATFLRESDFVLPTAIDMAVPVPLHEARYRERGFNQVELIFGAWLEGQGLPPGAGTRAHEADGAALQDAAVGAAAEPQGRLLHGAGCRRQRQAHPAAR